MSPYRQDSAAMNAATQRVAELINPASENKISANTLFKAQAIVGEVVKCLTGQIDHEPLPK